MNRPKLGIIAGRGHLPLEIAKSCIAEGRDYLIIGFEDQTDESCLTSYTYSIRPFGVFGETLAFLKEQGIEELVLAGKFKRPSWHSLSLDLKTTKFIAKIAFKALGDDNLLRIIAKELEEEGFRIVSVSDVMQNILTPYGVMGKVEPNKISRIDIQKGIEIACQIGQLDIGQAVVVQGGVVLGVEAIEGTDGLIERTGRYKLNGQGGVLVKMKKPIQDNRLDLPTIGVNTVLKAIEAGLQGIALEAEGTLIVQKQDVIDLANQNGLFIIGVHTSYDPTL
jgi:UDP-2,3-diacylglucosamine hydrolase